MKIILASQSPRRRELLARLGLPFSAQAPDIDETMEPGEDPAREVARVSRAKAMAVEAAPMEAVLMAADMEAEIRISADLEISETFSEGLVLADKATEEPRPTREMMNIPCI